MKAKMLRKGISPVIATVIIVAVAVAISIAVVGWIMGLWGSISAGAGSLQVYPDSYINVTSSPAVLELHLKNTGSGKITIYELTVGGFAGKITGFQATTATPTSAGQVYVVSAAPSGACYVDAGGNIIVKPNGECTLQIGLDPSWTFASSGTYSVNIFTKEAGKITVQISVG